MTKNTQSLWTFLPPTTKFGQGNISEACVKNSVHREGCVGRHPPGADTPLGTPPRKQTSLRNRHPSPPEADTPEEQTPPRQTPPGSRHPSWADTPPSSANWEIRATSGRYASCWNAYLSCILRGKNVFYGVFRLQIVPFVQFVY